MLAVAQKLDLLTASAAFDVSQGECVSTNSNRELRRWISTAIGLNGRRVPLLKVLQSSACVNDCGYCGIRCGRDARRATFSPDDLAKTFDEFVRRRLVEGLFLSSGVAGDVTKTTDRMLATVELVRKKYRFEGYIHLKILPHAETASIAESLRYADRVSVNLEAPNSGRIGTLSGSKDFYPDLLQTLTKAHELRSMQRRKVSLTTQFVVGAAGETDKELLTTTNWLYRELQLARVYYSRFSPIERTPLEGLPAAPAWREHRLYQADFMLRDYGFTADEFFADGSQFLTRSADPKLAWAQHHPERFPIEVNHAGMSQLLRIPGVGPVYARQIMERRKQGRLRLLDQMGLPSALQRKAAPFVLLDGHRPPYQVSLFGAVR